MFLNAGFSLALALECSGREEEEVGFSIISVKFLGFKNSFGTDNEPFFLVRKKEREGNFGGFQVVVWSSLTLSVEGNG